MNPFAPRAIAPAIAVVCSSLLAAAASAQCLVTAPADVSGDHNPFLAGQPPGTQLGSDLVPDQAPKQLALALVGDELLRFAGAGGTVTSSAPTGGSTSSGPEGDPVQIAGAASQLGVSGYSMPAAALLGVFLPATTNAGAAPPGLDFSSPASRDFDRLSPLLYQTFFVGDGLRADGVTLQEFVVPAGAERLFLGVADTASWLSNSGAFTATVEQEVADITQFCTAKVTSEGCLPTMGYGGYPALNGGHSFDVVCANVSPGKRGTLFYGHAAYNVPFQGGYLCTNVMIKRTPLVKSPPSASGLACSSSFTFDFNAWILSGNDPTLVPGETIYAQWWMRDAGAPSNTGLSDAIEIQLCQ